MNIEVMERHAPSVHALDGKVALVTGSTSGIGLVASVIDSVAFF